MSLGPIATLKEQASTYAPVLLFDIAFAQFGQASPPTLRLCSHMLSGTSEGGGGFAYSSKDYLPRIKNTEQLAQQLLSSQGIDFVPEIRIEIDDPDSSIYGNWETFLGFKGATLTATFVFWQANTANFSSDSLPVFVGVCGGASCPDEATTVVRATNKANMINTPMPPVQLQPTCPWNFPQSVKQMQDAADIRGSAGYECGYSPCATGANAVGNLAGSTTLTAGVTANATVWPVATTTPPSGVQYPFWVQVGSEEAFVTGLASPGNWTVVRNAHGTTATPQVNGAAIKIPYPSCNFTRQNCMQRLGNPSGTSIAPDGDILHDIAGHSTGRFGGSQWLPPAALVSRNYTTSKWEEIIFAGNEAKYGDRVPLCYGTTWVEPLVLNTSGDANYTKYEVLCSYGQINWVYDVIVNGVKVRHVNNDTVMTQVPGELTGGSTGQQLANGAWQCINDGRRNGNLNSDIPYKKQGDPYGSMAVLYIIVPVQLATANGSPSIQVLLDGQSVRVYSDPVTYTYQYSDNYAWIMMDILQWAGWTLETNFNIAKWIAAATYYDGQISRQDRKGVTGNTIYSMRPGVGNAPYKRFACSLTVRQRTSAAELLRGLRNACRSLLIPNYTDGTLAIQPKNTLAIQQPSVAQLNGTNSSNYNTAVPSVNDAGANANGYAVYYYNESNIALDNNERTTFKILDRSIQDQPNSLTLYFQDAENKYTQDSLTWVDVEDDNRIGQPVIATIQALGTNTFDRAQRAAATWIAENMRGNPRMSIRGETIGDTGGSVGIEFQTSFKALGQKIGDLILVSYQQRSVGVPTPWLFRIYGIQPGMDYRYVKITAYYHNDAWYVDTFGQTGAPLYRHPQSGPTRPPYGLCPNVEVPVPGDALYKQTYRSFSVTENASFAADGTAQDSLTIVLSVPVNIAAASPQPPLVELQATTAGTGGTIPGGATYYFLVCSKDVTGSTYLPSFPSARMAQAVVPAATNTNTCTVQTPYWDGVATGWVLFAGTNPMRLSYQADGDATPGTMPATITLTQYKDGSWGVPDPAFDHVQLYKKTVIHAGVADTDVISCTSTTITVNAFPGVPIPTNFFAGYTVTLYGVKDENILGPSQSPIPIFNAVIVSNTSDTLTLGPGLDGVTPDPTAVVTGRTNPGLALEDLLIIRSKPTYGVDAGGRYVTDSAWVNVLGDLDPTSEANVVALTNANPGKITTAAEHNFTTGDLVYISGMTGTTSVFPGRFTVTVVDTTNFTIGANTTSAGTYTGVGGTAYKQDQGLTPDAEIGNLWRVIVPGAIGYGVPEVIVRNTSNKLYFNGPSWPAGSQPTSASIGIIEEPAWHPAKGNDYTQNDNKDLTITLTDDVVNEAGQSVLLIAKSVNASNDEALEVDSPVRDFYLFGAGMPVVTVTDHYQARTTDQIIVVDCSVKNKDITVTLSPTTSVHTKGVIVKKAKTDTSSYIVTVRGYNGEALD